MKAPLIRGFRPRRTDHSDVRSDERGVTMVLVAVAMVAIIGIAAWSIDLVTLYLAREEAQRAADAAALTAARIISVSGITGTASPTTDTAYWQSICGGAASTATQAAQAIGGQNGVGSVAATVTVKYATGDGSNATADCSALTAAVFAVNPLVTVQVRRASLPTFFSRIWGNTGNSVSATAIAEAFNPSASDVNTNGPPTGAVTPVQPRCVKPWMVPNRDPGNPVGCSGLTCLSFVSTINGSIQNAGISTGGGPGGVIGESFNLFADCGTGSPCTPPLDNPPKVDSTTLGAIATPPQSLEYLPGEVLSSSVAVPACATSGAGGVADYEPAVAGCDQSTIYQCGVASASASPANAIDLSENPGGVAGDTANGLACSLTNQSGPPLAGQDVLDITSFPFKITAGAANPLKISNGTLITSSNAIVSLPIYDDTAGGGTLTFIGTRAEVTIVGFLQVFINTINPDGSVNVTVLNVAGCGNGSGTTPNTAVNGSSPVPVRLITPP